MARLFIGLSLSLALVASPESQVILGNSAGLIGAYLYPVLLVVLAVMLITLRGYSTIKSGEFTMLADYYGLWLPLTTILASRFMFFVTASTVVLATAGYVFNEVFISSFPNFGFAFLILGFVLVIQLVSQRLAISVQVLFVSIWLSGIAYLIVHGLASDIHSSATGEIVSSFKGFLLPFLLLVGVEFAQLNCGENVFLKNTLTPLLIGLCAVFFILMAWAFVMGKVVRPELLSSSYIPHTKTASRLLGDAGRSAIGMSMIAGTCALVNGLLLMLVAQVKEACQSFTITHKLVQAKWFSIAIILLIGISPGLMMARGMAGYEITEVYLRAALIFWLLHFGLVNLSMVGQATSLFKGLHGIVVVVFVFVSVGLVYLDEDTLGLFKVLCITFLGSGFLATLIHVFCSKKYKKHRV